MKITKEQLKKIIKEEIGMGALENDIGVTAERNLEGTKEEIRNLLRWLAEDLEDFPYENFTSLFSIKKYLEKAQRLMSH